MNLNENEVIIEFLNIFITNYLHLLYKIIIILLLIQY